MWDFFCGIKWNDKWFIYEYGKKKLNFVNCLMSLCYNGCGFFVMLFFIYCILLSLSYFLCKGIVLVIYEL